MANTTNLDLVKPAGTDKALVSVINANSDKIDAFAGTTNQALSNLTTPATASDLNTVTTPGVVYANDSTSNRPHDWCIVYTYAVNSTTLAQMAFCISDTKVYYRRNNGSWSAWEELAMKSDVSTSYYDIQNIGLIRFVGKVAMLYFMNSSGEIPSSGFQLPYTFADDVRCLCQYYDGSSNVIGELRIFKNGKVYVRNNGAYRNATYVLAQVSMYLT